MKQSLTIKRHFQYSIPTLLVMVIFSATFLCINMKSCTDIEQSVLESGEGRLSGVYVFYQRIGWPLRWMKSYTFGSRHHTIDYTYLCMDIFLCATIVLSLCLLCEYAVRVLKRRGPPR